MLLVVVKLFSCVVSMKEIQNNLEYGMRENVSMWRSITDRQHYEVDEVKKSLADHEFRSKREEEKVTENTFIYNEQCLIYLDSEVLRQDLASGGTFVHVFLSVLDGDHNSILVNESESRVINPEHWAWIVGTEGLHLARLPFDFTFLSLGTLKTGVNKVTIEANVSDITCFNQANDEGRLKIIANSILNSVNTTTQLTLNSICIEKLKLREDLQISWYYINFVSSYLIFQINTYYECWGHSETTFKIDREEYGLQLTVVFVISFMLSLFFPLFLGFFHRIAPIVYKSPVADSGGNDVPDNKISEEVPISPLIIIHQPISEDDLSATSKKFLSLETDLSLGIKHSLLYFGNCHRVIFIARWIFYILLFIALPYIPISLVQSADELDFSKRREKTFSNDILNANFNIFSHIFFNLAIFLMFSIVLYFKVVYPDKFSIAVNEKESQRKKWLWWKDLPDKLKIPNDEYKGTQKFLFLLTTRMKMGAGVQIWRYGLDIYKDLISSRFKGMTRVLLFIILALPFFIVFLFSVLLLSIPTLYCFTRVVLFSVSFRVLNDAGDTSPNDINFTERFKRRLSNSIERYFKDDSTDAGFTNAKICHSEANNVNDDTECEQSSIVGSSQDLTTEISTSKVAISTERNDNSVEVERINEKLCSDNSIADQISKEQHIPLTSIQPDSSKLGDEDDEDDNSKNAVDSFPQVKEIVWYTFLGIAWNSHKVGPYVLFVLIFLAYSVPVLTGYYDDYCQLLTKIIIIMKLILKDKRKEEQKNKVCGENWSMNLNRPSYLPAAQDIQTADNTAVSLVKQRYGHVYITAVNMPYNMAINRELFDYIVGKYQPTGPNKIARLVRIFTFAILLYCGIEALLGLNEFSNVSDEIKLFISILIAGILPTLTRIVQNQGQKTREQSIRVMEMRRDVEMYFVTGKPYRDVGYKWPTENNILVEKTETKFDDEGTLDNMVYRLYV
ncbi:uncharacterized protein LOC117125114 isoform X2 [Anneissia japonica]|uniref:uncharacterized protein LOC117125114 isoform X2 n=1 Tax=Anneissia japonica TaxID=1529436 RepID=UPI00142591E5|nr:uncharacterized protein LOC117125114 isoform X2 [Anneissia japonica]